MKLFILPLSFSNKKLKLYLDSKEVALFSWNKPLQVKIKKPKIYRVNIKEGVLKNHYFKIDLKKDTLLYLKKKFDLFGTRVIISQDKKFKTLINWTREPE